MRVRRAGPAAAAAAVGLGPSTAVRAEDDDDDEEEEAEAMAGELLPEGLEAEAGGCGSGKLSLGSSNGSQLHETMKAAGGPAARLTVVPNAVLFAIALLGLCVTLFVLLRFARVVGGGTKPGGPGRGGGHGEERAAARAGERNADRDPDQDPDRRAAGRSWGFAMKRPAEGPLGLVVPNRRSACYGLGAQPCKREGESEARRERVLEH